MDVSGRCYCGRTTYRASGDPLMRVQCHCRECQYISGGAPVLIMAMPTDGFSWTGEPPKGFTRPDLESPVTREFCPECGTHLTTRSPGMPTAVMIKVGTLDDPSVFDGPQMAIFTSEKQAFHAIAEGIPVFDGLPG